MPEPTHDTPPDRCILRHRMFSVREAPLFRRAETDGTPVMAESLFVNQLKTLPVRLTPET